MSAKAKAIRVARPPPPLPTAVPPPPIPTLLKVRIVDEAEEKEEGGRADSTASTPPPSPPPSPLTESISSADTIPTITSTDVYRSLPKSAIDMLKEAKASRAVRPTGPTGAAGAPAAASIALRPYTAMNTLRSYKEFSEEIEVSFWDRDSAASTALDIIAVYLKGQKILYIEAKTYCEQHLNTLMLPAILISAICTVISVSLSSYGWGTILVSSLTAANSFILSLISYLKLDAKAEAHKISSYQFDKLQTLCEFHSGRVLFFKDVSVVDLVEDIQKKVDEVKDTNQFIIPESVRYRFPILYGTNVFSEVKKVENEETVLKNQLNVIFQSLDRLAAMNTEDRGVSEKIKRLESEKMAYLTKYLELRNWYMKMDTIFNEEIEEQIKDSRRGCCWNPLNWLKS